MFLLLSLVAAICGMRSIIVLNIPLFVATVWRLFLYRFELSKEKLTKKILSNRIIQAVLVSFAGVVFSGIGYGINVLLGRKYTFGGWYISKVLWTKFDSERMVDSLSGWFDLFGFRVGESIFSMKTIYNIVPVILIVVLIALLNMVIIKKKQLSPEWEELVLFFFSGFILLEVLFSFTDLLYAERYLIPIEAFIFILSFLLFDEMGYSRRISFIGISLIILYLSGYFVANLHILEQEDSTKESREVSTILGQNGYLEGYTASYWMFGANITEYTDGRVETWRLWPEDVTVDSHLQDILSCRSSITEPFSHIERKPNGKVFVILPCPWKKLRKRRLFFLGMR